MDDLVGSWTLETRDQHFDSFLQCRQVNWFLRTIMENVSADVAFELSQNKTILTKKTFSSLKNSVYPMKINEDFIPEKTLSGKKEIGRVFETSGKKVIQEMKLEEDNNIIATIERKVIDNKLHVKLKCRDIICEEVYKRKF